MLRKIFLGGFGLFVTFLEAISWVLWAFFRVFSKLYRKKYRNDLERFVFLGSNGIFIFILGLVANSSTLALFGLLFYLIIGLIANIHTRRKWGSFL